MAMSCALLVCISILFVVTQAGSNVTHLPLCKRPRKIKLEVRDFKPVLSWKNSSTFGQAFENFDVQTCLTGCRNIPSNCRWVHRDCTYIKTHKGRYYCKLNLRAKFNGKLRICPFLNESATEDLCTVENKSCRVHPGVNIAKLSEFSKPRFTLINNSSTSVELNVKERSGKFLCNFDEMEYKVYIEKITNKQETNYCVKTPPNKDGCAIKQSHIIKKESILNPCDTSTNPSTFSLKFDDLEPASSYCVFGTFETTKLNTPMGPSPTGYIKVTTKAAPPLFYIIFPSVFSSIIFIALLGIAIKYGLAFRKSIIEKSPLVEEMFKEEKDDLETHQLLHSSDYSRVDEFIVGEISTNLTSQTLDTVVSKDNYVPKYIAKKSESEPRNEDHGSTSSSGFSSSEVFQHQRFPFQNDEEFVASHDYWKKSGNGILRQLEGNDSKPKRFSSPNKDRFVNLKSSCSNLNQQRNKGWGGALMGQSLRSTASSSGNSNATPSYVLKRSNSTSENSSGFCVGNIEKKSNYRLQSDENVEASNSYWDKDGDIIIKEVEPSNTNFSPSGSSSYWDKNGEVMLEQSEEICNFQTEAVTSKTSFKENKKNPQTSVADYISKLQNPDCEDLSDLLDNTVDDTIKTETNEEHKILINENERNSAIQWAEGDSAEMLGLSNGKANRFSRCSSGIQEDIANTENEIIPLNTLCTSHLDKSFEENPCFSDYDLSSLGTSVKQYQTVSDFGDRFQTQPLLKSK